MFFTQFTPATPLLVFFVVFVIFYIIKLCKPPLLNKMFCMKTKDDVMDVMDKYS